MSKHSILPHIFILLLGCFSFSFSSLHAQNRAVVLVFDDSGSMNGAPFLSVDYAMQMVIGLLHPNDELYYVKGINSYEPKSINITDKTQAVKTVQNWTNHRGHGFYGMCEAAMTKLWSPELADKEKWLIVTSDGEWRDIKPEVPAKLESFLKNTKTNIVFLSINDIHEGGNTLYPLLSDFELVDLYQSLPEPNDLRAQLVKIATTLSAFPTKGFGVESNGSSVRFTSELPIQELLILEQAPVPVEQLSGISDVTANGQPLTTDRSTTLSTFPTMKNWTGADAKAARLSAKMTTVSDKPGIIPAGAIVEVTFDRNVNLENMEFLPKVAAKLVVTASPIGKAFKNSGKDRYEICDTESAVLVEAQLVALDGTPLSEDILQKVTVTARHDGGELPLVLKEQTFSGELPLTQPLTTVAVEAFYEGYLNLRSNVVSFEKVHCPKLQSDNVRLEKSVSVLDLDKPLEFVASPVITLEGRDITRDIFDDLELEEISNSGIGFQASKEDGQLVFKTTLASRWLCAACLSKAGRDSVVYQITAPGYEFERPLQLTLVVNKTDAPFWEKCGTCIIKALLLLLLLIYLWGIIRKPRFAKGALITYKRITEFVPSRDRNYELKTSFFNRYFVPFVPEKKTVQGILFQANKDDSYVTLPKKSQKKGMYIQNNELQKPGTQERQLIANGKLEVRRRNRTDEYIYRKG